MQLRYCYHPKTQCCSHGHSFRHNVAAVHAAPPVSRSPSAHRRSTVSTFHVARRNQSCITSASARTLDVQPENRQQDETEVAPGIFEGFWQWRGYTIRYQRSGTSGPPLLMVHGFGGNCDHWRKNLPVLGQKNRAFAIDLLGYGYSDKPDPREFPDDRLYSFENWGAQLLDFMAQIIGGPAFLVSNSVGGLAALEAAIQQPEQVPAAFVTNISLRKLHATNQSWIQRPFVAALQRVLRETQIGEAFFANVAKQRTVKNILQQCYGDKAAVTDELVEKILTPGLRPGAARVFLDFLSYSDGPLPEVQLQNVKVPVTLLWGAKDPWEKVEWGRQLALYPSVQQYIELDAAGHCPMDEAPDLVNNHIQEFLDNHAQM